MTISDIAKMAGVSSAAVSRYFNNGYLSEDKKEMIRRVVEETGYRPSTSAQMLRTRKTKTLALIIPTVSNLAMAGIMEGIQPIVDEQGYRILLACTYGDMKREQEYLEVFDESEVDGILLAGTMFSANHRKVLSRVKVPVVVIGQDVPGFSSVYFDDYHALYALTNLFIEKGRRNLGYIGVTEKDRAAGEFRRKGFCAALRDHGLSACKDFYMISGFSFQSGYNRMGELFEMNPELDAVICATDQQAIGARCWLRDNHPELVERIALAGQGDEEALRVCNPPISTIRYQYPEAGAAAANRLLDLINREDTGRRDIKEIMLGFELIDRLV